jgi:hypothetical protein
MSNSKQIINEKIKTQNKTGKKIMLVKTREGEFFLSGDTYPIRKTIKKAGWDYEHYDFHKLAGHWYTKDLEDISNIVDVANRSNKFYIQVHISCSR